MTPLRHIGWMAGIAIVSVHPVALRAQEALPPWIGGMPGTEHPAAWALQDDTWSFGLQHATRWAAGEETLADQWFGAGWNPTGNRTGWSGSGLDRWAFGTAHSAVQAGSGWRESRHALHAALQVPLDNGWTGSAGFGLGARAWILDGRTWSWDAQYGPGGYDPTASTGEPDGLVGGAGVEPEVSLGVAAQRSPRGGQGPLLRGAAGLHHVLSVPAPTFQPMAGDTVRRTMSGWFEVEDDLGVKRLTWTAWVRGAVQGPSHFIEIGSSAGWTFGNASRHTRNTLGHRLDIGMLWRSDGRVRIPFSWTHAELRVWTGPGLDVGHPLLGHRRLGLRRRLVSRLLGATPIGSN